MIKMVLCAVVMLFFAAAAHAEDKAPAKQLIYKIKVFEGDPKGSVAAGTVRVVAEPALVTVEDRPCSFNVGGEVAVQSEREVRYLEFGHRVEIRSGRIKNGKILLDVEVSISEVVRQKEDEAEIQGRSLRVVRSVPAGRPEVFRFPARPGGKEAWFELTVTESVPGGEPVQSKGGSFSTPR
jgi:hypothetical protein